MARILVCEPHPEVRELLRHVLARLGHEAVVGDGSDGGAGAVDALIVEPAHPRSLATAHVARRRSADLPIVCASIKPPTTGMTALRPAAYLVKPFGIPELERALADALAGRPNGSNGKH